MHVCVVRGVGVCVVCVCERERERENMYLHMPIAQVYQTISKLHNGFRTYKVKSPANYGQFI